MFMSVMPFKFFKNDAVVGKAELALCFISSSQSRIRPSALVGTRIDCVGSLNLPEFCLRPAPGRGPPCFLVVCGVLAVVTFIHIVVFCSIIKNAMNEKGMQGEKGHIRNEKFL